MLRPKVVTDEQLEYLDDLRDSGITNIFRAAPYVKNVFDLSYKEALEVLTYWIKSFVEEGR